MTNNDELLTPPEAAKVLKVQVSTLNVWRCKGFGPVYHKMNGRIRYCRSDLMKWFFEAEDGRRLIESTARCHAHKRGRVDRLRGRRAVDERERRLAVEPYCRDCRRKGLTRLAEEVDHITPLADGGTDHDDNVRSLCKSCHATRTRERLLKNAPPLRLHG